jgi:hypothetical protein
LARFAGAWRWPVERQTAAGTETRNAARYGAGARWADKAKKEDDGMEEDIQQQRRRCQEQQQRSEAVVSWSWSQQCGMHPGKMLVRAN